MLLLPPPTLPFTLLRRRSTATLYPPPIPSQPHHRCRRLLLLPILTTPRSPPSSSSAAVSSSSAAAAASSSTEEEPIVSILSVLRSHDIPEDVCTSFVSRCPECFRRMKPMKTLDPKLEFLRSSAGLSGEEVGEIILANPYILRSKLHPTLSSFVAFLSSALSSKEELVTVLKMVLCSPTDRIKANIQALRDGNVPESVIHKILLQYPRSLVSSTHKFAAVLDVIKKLGLTPTDTNFAGAVSTTPYTTEGGFSTKVELFKELGWSEEQVFSMFRRSPSCVGISEANLREKFAYSKEVLGWGPEVFCTNPRLLALSLEERIIPRSAVLSVLISRGLLKRNSKNLRKFMISDDNFLTNYVDKYKGEIGPEILEAYVGNKKKNKKNKKNTNFEEEKEEEKGRTPITST